MTTLASVLLLAALPPAASGQPSTQPTSRPLPTPHLAVAYVPNWIDTAAFAKTLPWHHITHLNLAFENPIDDAGNLAWSPANAPLIAGAKAQGVKILLSLGGGAASTDKTLLARYAKLLAPANRAAFAAKLAAFAADKHLDGLDIDLEGPAITADYPPFIADLARETKARNLLLTAALSVGYGGDKVPPETLALFDLIHIMAYDATGPWNPNRPGQHAPLEMARNNIAFFHTRGVPHARLTLGLPFYGYGFGPAFRTRDYPFRDIVAEHKGAELTDQTGDTIFYNGLPTVRAKTALARDLGLAGLMIWSLDLDAAGDKSLLTAIHETLSAQPTIPQPAEATSRAKAK